MVWTQEGMVNTTESVSTNASQENDIDSVPSQEAAAKLMWEVFSPILIIVGTIGNVLTIIVLSRKSIINSGMTLYLICLAVADLLVLYTGLLPQWVVNTFNTNTHNSDSFICKVSLWMVYFSLDLSAWILVSVTIMQATSVGKLCTDEILNRKVFVVNIVVLVIVLLLINGHFLLGFDVVGTETDDTECSPRLSVEYEQFQSRIFPWIDLVLFSLGPFLCHLVGNMVIVITLIRAVRSMAEYSLENAEQVDNQHNRVLSMTVLLLSKNAIYVLCTLPISMYFIQDAIYSPEPTAERQLLYTCLHLLMYLNNSTNFVTYVVSGKRFRKALCSFCCRKPMKPRPDSRSDLSTSRTSTSYMSTVI